MPGPTSYTLSASQEQLLKSVQQLQDAQRENMNEYANAQDQNERKIIMDKMKKNEALRTNLLASASNVNLVQTQELNNQRNAAEDLALLVQFAEQELQQMRERLDAIQNSHAGKKRMIELNTYYGKRFMAQAGVMKIFIYMCIPVLILAVLANMGLLPNYIAGFIIIAIIVVGIVYIYAAVHDINRRDKMNFDEYTWEFDPSRVGTIINPNYGGKSSLGDMDIGCVNGDCCNNVTTKWDPESKTCVIQDAQGGGSAVKGANVSSLTEKLSSEPAALLGNLTSRI
jgi:hypothetical protein